MGARGRTFAWRDAAEGIFTAICHRLSSVVSLSSTSSKSPTAARIRRLTSALTRRTFSGVDAHAVIASPAYVAADGAAESAAAVVTLLEVPGAGDSPAPAVVVTPHHRDELLGAAAAAAPSTAPSMALGTPRHRSRRLAGSAFEQVVTVVLIRDHRAVPAPGRNGVFAGRGGRAESAPPFTNARVARSRTGYGSGQPCPLCRKGRPADKAVQGPGMGLRYLDRFVGVTRRRNDDHAVRFGHRVRLRRYVHAPGALHLDMLA